MAERSIPGTLPGAGRNGLPERPRNYVYRGLGYDIYEDAPGGGPGRCECGCGGATERARRTDARFGMVKGVPLRFIHGHNLERRPGPLKGPVRR